MTAWLAIVVSLRAQELPPPEPIPRPRTWTLAELEDLALQTNPTLLQARSLVDAARGQAFQASRLPNPTLGYSGQEIGDDGRAGQHGLFWGKQFVPAEKITWRIRTAEAEILQAEQVWSTQTQRVLNDVRSLFYDSLYAQEYVMLARQLVEVGERGVQIAEARFAGMETGRGDVLQARIEWSESKLRLADAELQSERAWRALTSVISAPDLPRHPLEGDLSSVGPRVEWSEALQRLLDNSPELALAAANTERAHAAWHREIAESQVNLQLQSGVSYDDATGDTFVSAQVSVPLRVRDRRTGAIDAARAEWTAAQQNLHRTESDLRQRLAVAFQGYELARQRYRAFDEEILPNARESLELVRFGYEAGEYDYLALLTAQRTFMRASLDRLEALREVRGTTVAIEGALLSGALAPLQGL